MAILHCGIGTFTWVKNLLKRTKIQDIVTFNRSLWIDYLMLIETKRGFSDISMWSASLKIKKGKILFYSFFVTFTNFGVKHMICVILLGLFSVCWETWRKRRHQAGACWQIRWPHAVWQQVTFQRFEKEKVGCVMNLILTCDQYWSSFLFTWSFLIDK